MKKLIKKSPLIRSFRVGNSFWNVLAFNTILILLLLSLIPLYTWVLRLNMDAMKPLDQSAVKVKQMIEGSIEQTPDLMEDFNLVASGLKLFFIKMGFITTMFLAAFFLIIGYFSSTVWSEILKKKFDRSSVLKYALIVFLWNIIWIILFFLIVFALKFSLKIIQGIAIAETFLYIYFSILVAPIFFRSNSILKTFKKTFVIGAIKIHRIFPSIIIMWVVFAILFNLFILFSSYSQAIIFWTAIILLMFYIAWIKFYINEVIEKVYS